jgi:hypothetical protein
VTAPFRAVVLLGDRVYVAPQPAEPKPDLSALLKAQEMMRQ